MNDRKLSGLLVGVTVLVLSTAVPRITIPRHRPTALRTHRRILCRPILATSQAIDVDLSWTCADPDGDSLTYDVYFGTSGSPPLVSSDQTLETYDPDTLANNQTYYWQITAHDNNNHATSSPVWSFVTAATGSTPPNLPTNPVPSDSATNQYINMDLRWTCTDPDGDPVTFDVYFGTSSNPPSVISGQAAVTYDPGVLANDQTYYWRIDAHDTHDHLTVGPIWTFTTEGLGPEDMALIPACPYSMGADYYSPYSLPIHTVTLPAYYMDRYEVTNAQYKAFCDATSRSYPADPDFSGMFNYFTDSVYVNYPVVNVDWNDAQAYALWAGKRLPTEAEWERAAKGDADNRQWPWGDTWRAAYANINDNPSDGHTYTAPVGIYPNGVSPVGCDDMAGNVWEWCEDDWHSSYTGALR